MYRTMLAIALLLTTGSQAYAPIQLVSDRGKGLVVLPQGFPGNIRGALMAPKLSVRSPASNDSPRSIPYFTARLDQTITWDDVDWCLEATGNKNGDAVRVNSCSGARAQKWNWIPDGRGHNMIQLSDTELCLHAIDKEVGPNGAPIKLRECGNEVAQWQFEESLPLPRTSQGDGIPYDARHVMIALLTLAGLGAVSLGARIWQVSATRNRKQESVCEVMALESMHPFRGAQAHASRTSNISMAEQKVFDFNSRRCPVYGSRGMVASSQTLASQAGLQILQAGGTAADACVAAAAALNVTEPCSTGLGGDAFALFYDASSKKVESLQGCGRSPRGFTLEAVQAHPQMVGRTELPELSALCVTVPGAAAAWESAVAKWGKLNLSEVLAPAISLAEEGFPLQVGAAEGFAEGASQLRQGAAGHDTPFLPDGQPPKAGEIFRNPDLASTFRLLGEHGAKKGFYSGRVAEAIVRACADRGGLLSMADLAAHETLFPEAISTTYRGKVKLWECSPPTQGITALMALNLLENEAVHPKLSSQTLHAQAESLRFAFADSLQWCADPDDPSFPGSAALLDKQAAAERWANNFNKKRCKSNITPRGASELRAGPDTVYLCAVDKWGNACSFINSNYMGFGTGIVPDGCGFTLQNRGHNFIVREGHPNCVGPNKFSYHTIIPGMATFADSGELFCAMGVMGGFMQPQGHLQVLAAMVDHGLDPQAALDQPRFCLHGVSSELGPESVESASLLLEQGIPEKTRKELERVGHRCFEVQGWDRSVFGRGQIICRDPHSGVLCGGTEPRADGAVVTW